jgi:hypothetical protein
MTMILFNVAKIRILSIFSPTKDFLGNFYAKKFGDSDFSIYLCGVNNTQDEHGK